MPAGVEGEKLKSSGVWGGWAGAAWEAGQASAVVAGLMEAIRGRDEAAIKELKKLYLEGACGNRREEVSRACHVHFMEHTLRGKDAAPEISELSSREPKDPVPHMWLGILHQRSGRLEEAAAEYGIAAGLTENDILKTERLCIAAMTTAQAGNTGAARDMLLKRIEHANKNAKTEMDFLLNGLKQLRKDQEEGPGRA